MPSRAIEHSQDGATPNTFRVSKSAADQEIAITWSPQILAEATEHPMKNVPGFDHAAATRLVDAMNRAFPLAEVEPSDENLRRLVRTSLPDEDTATCWPRH